jgi:hypothetical protein
MTGIDASGPVTWLGAIVIFISGVSSGEAHAASQNDEPCTDALRPPCFRLALRPTFVNHSGRSFSRPAPVYSRLDLEAVAVEGTSASSDA